MSPQEITKIVTLIVIAIIITPSINGIGYLLTKYSKSERVKKIGGKMIKLGILDIWSFVKTIGCLILILAGLFIMLCIFLETKFGIKII